MGGGKCFPSVQKYMVCAVQTGSWACSKPVSAPGHWASCHGPRTLWGSVVYTSSQAGWPLSSYRLSWGPCWDIILIISSSSHQNREAPLLEFWLGCLFPWIGKAEGGSYSALGHSGKDAPQLWEGDRGLWVQGEAQLAKGFL